MVLNTFNYYTLPCKPTAQPALICLRLVCVTTDFQSLNYCQLLRCSGHCGHSSKRVPAAAFCFTGSHWFSWRIWNCRSRSSTAQCALYLILFEKQKKKVSPGCHGFGSTATWPHLRDTKTEKANYPLTQRDELFGTLWNHAGVTWVIWFYTNLWSQCTLVVVTEGKVLKNAPLHIVKVNATHI